MARANRPATGETQYPEPLVTEQLKHHRDAAVYLVVVMIGAGPLGLDLGGGTTTGISRYPYTFLDPGISGVGGVAIFIGAMIVAFVALGYLIFAIDRVLGRIANRNSPKQS